MAGRQGRFFRTPMARLSAFRILMAGSSISMLGSRISTVAFPMLVLHLDNSPLVAGLVTCAAIVPSMLFYIPAGAFVDRWDPWHVMLASELMRGIAVASVVVSLWAFSGHVSIYLLIAFMIIEEILEIFWLLADRRYMSRLMEPHEIESGQASIEVRTHAAVLAGRPIGPFLFTLTPYLPFLADAISFVASVGAIISLRGRQAGTTLARTTEKATVRGTLRRDIGEGFRWLRRNRYATAVLVMMSFMTMIAQAMVMMFLAEAHDNKLSTVAIGVVLAASGAGGAIGSVVAGRLPARIKERWLQIQLCAWTGSLGLLALVGVRFSWCIVAVMLVLGLTGAIGNIEFGAYLIVSVGDGMLGRITGIGQVITIGAVGFGPLLGGGAMEAVGTQAAVSLFFYMVLAGAVALLFIPWIFTVMARQGTVEALEIVPEESGPSGITQAGSAHLGQAGPGIDFTSPPLCGTIATREAAAEPPGA